MSVVAAPRPTPTRLVTVALAPGPEVADVRSAFDSLAGRLVDEELVVLQERIYAESAHADAVLSIRSDALRRAGLPDDVPVTVVASRSCEGRICSAIHVLAVRLDPSESVRTLTLGDARARELRSDSLHALFVSDIVPPNHSDDPLGDLFAGLLRAVTDGGLALEDVARTWLYVADLLPTYARLNEARDALFTEAGLLGADGWRRDPPASTGIGGVHRAGAPCFADVVAVRGTGAFTAIHPALQCEAWDYGSSFSRGMKISLGGRELVTISGTASIGKDGATRHVGDPEAQIFETLANVDAMLDSAGADAPGAQWTLYFKDEPTWQAWQRLEATGRVRQPPGAAAIFGDVCRDELLFKAEVTVPVDR